jgi:hypothetical protein
MVPICTEIRLRFSARLHDGARTLRFKRVKQ